MARAVAASLVELEVQLQGLGHLLADGEHRVQRGHRLLEDHRDAVTANLADLVFVELEEVLALEEHLTGNDAAGRDRDQLEEGEGADALAAAALAHECEGFAFLDVVGDAVHGLDQAFFGIEVGPEDL